MNKMYCDNCGKELKPNMEIEYSTELCEYYCCPDCATNRYFDHMGSRPIEKDMFNDYGIVMKNNELFYKK